MNAYLPTLARASEEVVKTRIDLHTVVSEQLDTAPLRTSNEGDGDASEPLLASQDEHPSHALPELEASTPAREAYNTALSRAMHRVTVLAQGPLTPLLAAR